MKIRNPNIEIRNKSEMRETWENGAGEADSVLRISKHWPPFVSDFGFRIFPTHDP